MLTFIRKIFIVYFLTINLLGLSFCLWDSKFSEKQKVIINGIEKTKIVKHSIDGNTIIFISALGGFLGFYLGTLIFPYEARDFYTSWGPLLILIYNLLLALSIRSFKD